MEQIIYINGAKFQAYEHVIDKVIKALENDGWTFDETTQGYVPPRGSK
jgi:hypothetical protein